MTSIESASAQPEAWLKLDRDGRTLAVGGAWTIAEAARLDRELDGLEPVSYTHLTLPTICSV